MTHQELLLPACHPDFTCTIQVGHDAFAGYEELTADGFGLAILLHHDVPKATSNAALLGFLYRCATYGKPFPNDYAEDVRNEMLGKLADLLDRETMAGMIAWNGGKK